MSKSVTSIAPGACVMQNSGRARCSASCGVSEVIGLRCALRREPEVVNTPAQRSFTAHGAQSFGKSFFQSLIDLQAKQARDPAARAKTLKDIQRRIIDQAAYQQITMPQAVFMHWPYVKNFNPNSNVNDGINSFARNVWFDK